MTTKINYLVKVSYDGNYFYGWSKQPNKVTVQGVIEKKLSSLFNEEINIIGSGRTDRYVHAISQYFNFYSTKSLPLEAIMNHLNRTNDIKVMEAKMVDFNFNSRFSSKKKIYQYKFLKNASQQNEVFLSHYYWIYDLPFNFQIINQAIEKLKGINNFSSFSSKENYQNPFRNLFDIKIILNNNVTIFQFEGEGFLRYMVRNIIGVLVALSENKITWQQFCDLLDNPEKGKSVYKAKGNALYLYDVEY